MNIYEVVFWNSYGRRDSEDTIYLVRAPTFRAAIEDVQRNGAPTGHGTGTSTPDVVYEVGVDVSPYAPTNPCILRGPYFERAVNRGWKQWRRNCDGAQHTNDWVEEDIVARGKIE
ncbi:MAG TPA: hypothetical protein VJA21_10125 [Verrucomicrobiae bacterium]